jgi:hypothetical protein
MRIIVPVLLTLVWLIPCCGCGIAARPSDAPPPPVLYEGGGLDTLVGQRVRIVGVAASLKRGAAVYVGKLPVYVGGLDEWPRSYVGRKLNVVGTVERIQEPEPGAAGVSGGFVLRNAAWGEVQE